MKSYHCVIVTVRETHENCEKDLRHREVSVAKVHGMSDKSISLKFVMYGGYLPHETYLSEIRKYKKRKTCAGEAFGISGQLKI